MERTRKSVVDADMSFEAPTLADDLIPGREFEIPRDLLRILAFCWPARADKGETHHPFQVLLAPGLGRQREGLPQHGGAFALPGLRSLAQDEAPGRSHTAW